MTERGENGVSLTSPWQRIEGGPIRDPPEQCLESLGFSAVRNENGEGQSRILSPLRLPFRHPGEVIGPQPLTHTHSRRKYQ